MISVRRVTGDRSGNHHVGPWNAPPRWAQRRGADRPTILTLDAQQGGASHKRPATWVEFDTAVAWQHWRTAGVEKQAAEAHRKGVFLEECSSTDVCGEEATLMQSRLEIAIANQTATIEARMLALVKVCAGFLTGLAGLALVIIKLT